MRRFMMTLTAMTVAATTLFLTANVASADEIDDYRDAMRSFSPVIQDWVAEVDEAAEASLAKPELLTSDELAHMAMRGQRIARDLEGTMAPGALADAQAELVTALNDLAAAALAAGDASPEAFVNAIAEPQAVAEAKLRQINALVLRAPRAPITIPVSPVTGN